MVALVFHCYAGRGLSSVGCGGLALPGSRAEQLAWELSGQKSLPTARELGRQYRENVMAQQLLTVKEEKALRSAQEMAQQTGAQVVIDRSLRKDANGYYQNGVIHLSEDMEQATITVFKHELTHHLQQTAPEEYQAFRAAAVELAGEQSVQQLQEQYARHGVQLTDEEALDEVAANFTEKLLTDSESIRQLIDTKPTLADRFFAALRELLQRLTGRVDPKLKQAEKLWTEAYQAAKGNKNTATEGGSAKFSIKRTSQMTLAQQIRAFYDGKMASSDAFYFGETPATLNIAGLDALPLAFTQSDFMKSTKQKHNIPRRVLKNLNKDLETALFAFVDGDRAGILTRDIDGDGKPLLVGIQIDVQMDNNRVNAIRSAYGLDNPGAWLKNQIDTGKFFALLDEKRANTFLYPYGYLASRKEGVNSINSTVTQNGQERKKKFSLKEDGGALKHLREERGDVRRQIDKL